MTKYIQFQEGNGIIHMIKQKEPTKAKEFVKRGSSMPDSSFDMEQLEFGTDEEMEHTNDREKAKKIAKDHLFDDSDYYIKLSKFVEKT